MKNKKYLSCSTSPLTLLAAAAVLATTLLIASNGHAQTLTVLYKFTGGQDGLFPYSSLIQDTNGHFYGTTELGGVAEDGTVYEVNASGGKRVLHMFGAFPDGGFVYSGVIRDAAGNFYGTTYFGGAFGDGTVYKIDTQQNESVLHSFSGSPDGANSWAGLLGDAAGNLYGTTAGGGTSGNGTVFKLDPSGTLTVLHSFSGSDGSAPGFGSLIRDDAGNLYGATLTGGASDLGTVFRLDPTGILTVLHSFAGGADGKTPGPTLLLDSVGNLYGTTSGTGGDAGTVFEIGPTGQKRTLYRFSGHADGQYPNGGLIRDPAGNLYGTTTSGGAFGLGTVFEVDRSGAETVLYSFSGPDGENPYSTLLAGGPGVFYGTTIGGGLNYGVVFKLTIP